MPVLAIGEGDIFTKFPVMSLTGIEIENFDVQGLALSTLAKHDADCSWAQLTAMLDYKLQMLVSSLPGSIREQPPGPARSVRPSPTGRSPNASTAAIADAAPSGSLLRRWLCTFAPSVSGPERARTVKRAGCRLAWFRSRLL
jgi:hypothetical protein